MTLVRYLNEGGQDGVLLTPANSGASLIAPTGTSKFDADQGVHGLGVESINDAGSSAQVLWPASAASKIMAFRGFVRGPGTTPANLISIIKPLDATNAAIFRINWTTANSVQLAPKTGSSITIATGLDPNAKYDYSVVCSIGSATVAPFDSTYTINVRDSAGVLQGSITGTAADFGVAAIANVNVGITGTLSASYVIGQDEWSLDNGRTTEIPLYVPAAVASTTLRPIAVLANPGGITVTGGAVDAAVAMADESDTTEAVWPGTVGAALDFSVTDLAAGAGAEKFRIRPAAATAGTGTFSVVLKQGTTTIKTWPTTTFNSTTYSTIELALSAAEVATMTPSGGPYANLHFVITQTA